MRGITDHGTTDDYFFLIISLLGRPVMDRNGPGAKSVASENVFAFSVHGEGEMMVMREREMDDWIRERCDTILHSSFVHPDESLRQNSSI